MTIHAIYYFYPDNIIQHSTHESLNDALFELARIMVCGGDFIAAGIHRGKDKGTYPDAEYTHVMLTNGTTYKNITVADLCESMGLRFRGIVDRSDCTPVSLESCSYDTTMSA